MITVPFLNIFKSLISLSIALFFGLSLLSYNELDQSFNKLGNFATKNFMGEIGAYTADPIIQLFGLSAAIFILISLCWSYVFWKDGKVSFWPLRLLSGVIAIASASLSLSFIDFNNSVFISLGGAAGILTKKALILHFSEDLIIYSSISIFIISFYYSLGLPIYFWLSLIKSFFSALGNLSKYFKLPSRKDCPSPIKDTIAPSFSKAEENPPSQKITKPNKTYNVLKNNLGEFILPSTELLQNYTVNKDLITHNKSVIKQNTENLLQVLTDFGLMGDIIGAASGPVVTLYEFEPAAGTKSSRVIGLADDISRSMKSTAARIAVIPGRNAIGIELPNKQRETVYLKELLDSKEYRNKDFDLPIILGKNISGETIVADLARMPHLLVAGTTGSGKSVAINTMILSLVYALTPDQCKFIMVDPKMLELSVYDGIPHLLTNVVTEPGKAVTALKWVVKEMETRYRLMSNLGVRNIHNYNTRIKEAIQKGEIIQRSVQTGFDPETRRPIIEQIPLEMKPLPFIVVIVDEMADLMLVAGKEIETSIQRLAQMARAAGIHIIMATQRPSVDVITGVIKANFPTRISFQVTSKIDSRTILGEQGAEQLLGKGDMLYMAGGSKITRIHGPFVSDNEVEKIVSYLKSQGQPDYMNDITSGDENFSSDGAQSNNNNVSDELYKQAVEIVQLEGKASTSFIQRCLKIGYNRAANIMEQMEKEGLVGKPNHVGKREIFM